MLRNNPALSSLIKRCLRSDMCSTTLSDSKFARRVSRLNLNVLHLCLSQNVPTELLHPTQTLQNILHLLDAADLGRYSCFFIGLQSKTKFLLTPR